MTREQKMVEMRILPGNTLLHATVDGYTIFWGNSFITRLAIIKGQMPLHKPSGPNTWQR